MDLVYTSAAEVRVLVVPVGGSTRRDYDAHLGLLRAQGAEVRLLDLAPQPHLHRFNPQSFPQGHLRFEFLSSMPDPNSVFLCDFEPHRKVFVVLGVGVAHEDAGDVEPELKRHFPTPIVHNTIWFDAPPSKLVPRSDHSSRSTFFYAGTAGPSIQSIMCDVGGNFLAALEGYALSYGKITLRSPVSFNSTSRMLPLTIAKAQKRLSNGGSFKLEVPSDNAGGNVPRQHGRLAKLLGNFCLLAGKHADALQHFNEASLVLKKCDDHLWLGSALEGIAVCTVLLQHAGVHYQLPASVLHNVIQIPKGMFVAEDDASAASFVSRISGDARASFSSPRTSSSVSLQATDSIDVSALPEFIRAVSQRVFQLYSLSMNEFENMVPDNVYIDALLRYIKFMVQVFVGGECNQAMLARIVSHEPGIKAATPSKFTKSEILREVDKVVQLQLDHVDVLQQCKIYCALASVYGDLDMDRKRALMLHVLMNAVLPRIQRRVADDLGAMGLRDIIDALFVAYGIEHHSWPSLQVPLLKLALNISLSAHDWSSAAHMCSVLLARYMHCLHDTDQCEIKAQFDELVQLCQRNNIPVVTAYWDPFLVRKVVFMSKANEDLVTLDNSNPTTEAEDPLIFNPYNKETKSAFDRDKIMVVGDVYQLKVTLQNPFAFEIDIEDFEVVSDGEVEVHTLTSLMRPVVAMGTPSTLRRAPSRHSSRFKSASALLPSATATSTSASMVGGGSSSLGAYSIRQFLVSFKALTVGELKVVGFNATISQCGGQFFKVIESQAAQPYAKVRHGSKPTGEDIPAQPLSLMVIKQQPLLSLSKISINNGWLMLLQGEKYKFSMQLTNQSSQVINYLSFSFWDSTVDTLNHKLANVGSTPALEVYEFEWSLLQFKPFRILNKEEIAGKFKQIMPQTDVTIEYEITGKKGMKESRLILEYANREAADEHLLVKYHVPIQLTVLPSIEVTGFDVLPLLETSLLGDTTLPADSSESQRTPCFKRFLDYYETQIGCGNMSEYCVLVIDVKNAWNETLWVNLQTSLSDGPGFSIEECMFSGKSTRLFVPFKRISSINHDLTAPIPSLRNRQFIKNYSITEQQDSVLRELFWLRSHLLEGLSAQWRTKHSSKNGVVNLRGIRLNPKMAKVLMKPKLVLTQRVTNDEGAAVDRNGSQYCLRTEEFYRIETTIANNAAYDVRGMLRQVPSPADVNAGSGQAPMQKSIFNAMDRNILVHGVLQKSVGVIARGKAVTVELAFTLLERGTYEWGCIFEELVSPTSTSKSGIVVGSDPILIQAT
ncbi:Uncharacterized protein ABC855_g2118 [[Candida] zeylanoides]